MLNDVVMVNARLADNWKRTIARDSVALTVAPFHRLTKRETRAVKPEAARYAALLGRSFLRTR